MIKQLILHNFLLEKHNAIVCTAIMGAVILLFSTILAGTYVDDTNTMRISYENGVGAATFALWFCLTYTASRMFRNLGNRRTAIPFLMLPASNKDKFLANCIMGIGGTFAMFFVGLIGADIIQALFNIATRYTTGSLTFAFFEDISNEASLIINDVQLFNNVLWNILMVFWCHSIFTLGSTMFRKHCFIKTCLSLIGLTILHTAIITSIAVSIAHSNSDITIHFLVDPQIMGSITAYAIVIAMIVGAYFWAYRRFCKKTIL